MSNPTSELLEQSAKHRLKGPKKPLSLARLLVSLVLQLASRLLHLFQMKGMIMKAQVRSRHSDSLEQMISCKITASDSIIEDSKARVNEYLERLGALPYSYLIVDQKDGTPESTTGDKEEKSEAPQTNSSDEKRKPMGDTTQKIGKYIPFYLSIEMDMQQLEQLNKLTPDQQMQVLGHAAGPLTMLGKVKVLTAIMEASDLSLQKLSAGNLLIDHKTLLCAQLRKGPLYRGRAACDNALDLEIVEMEPPKLELDLGITLFQLVGSRNLQLHEWKGIIARRISTWMMDRQVETLEAERQAKIATEKAKIEAERKAKEEAGEQWFLVMGSTICQNALIATGPLYVLPGQPTPEFAHQPIQIYGQEVVFQELSTELFYQNRVDQYVPIINCGLIAVLRKTDEVLYNNFSLVKQDLIPEGVAIFPPEKLLISDETESFSRNPGDIDKLAQLLGIQKPMKHFQARYSIVLDFEAPDNNVAQIVVREALKAPIESIDPSHGGDLFFSVTDRLSECTDVYEKLNEAFPDSRIKVKPIYVGLDRLVELP